MLGSDINSTTLMLTTVLSARRRTDRDLQEEGADYDACELQCVRAPPMVGADLHRVHLRPGHSTSAAVALDGHPVWDARHRVWGEDHRMPFLDLTTAPDPDDGGRLQGNRLLDRTGFPATAATACGK